MKRIILILSALFLMAAACGSGADGGADASISETQADPSTTTAAVQETASSTSATTEGTAASSNAAQATTTTAAPPDTGSEISCLDFWSEEFVQAKAGEAFSLFDTNIDETTCAFNAGAESVTGFFRAGDQGLFDQSKTGAAATGEVMDIDGVCDTAWYTTLGGAFVVAEGLSSDQGLIFNATITGTSDPVAVATAMLVAGCEGPNG